MGTLIKKRQIEPLGITDSDINSISISVISDFPEIPAAQVQSDWNASTGLGVLLNKPTNFDKSYLQLTDTIDESYIGKATSVPMVTVEEDGLQLMETEELITETARFVLLGDVPQSYTGYEGYFVRVRQDGQGLEFVAP